MGILGGMGPVASVRFCAEVLRHCQELGAVQDEDYPVFILMNAALPGAAFTEAGIADSEIVQKHLRANINRLAEAGADFIVVPCASVHGILQEFEPAITGRLVSMLQVTKTRIAAMNVRTVGVLASQSTHAFGLWQQALSDIGVTCLEPDCGGIEMTKRIILGVMGGRQNEREKRMLFQQVQSLVDRGAEAVILGCTELGSVPLPDVTAVPVVDCTRVLAEKCVQFTTNEL